MPTMYTTPRPRLYNKYEAETISCESIHRQIEATVTSILNEYLAVGVSLRDVESVIHHTVADVMAPVILKQAIKLRQLEGGS